MLRGRPGTGKAKTAKAPSIAIKRKRGGAKGPRRPAAVRLKELRAKYDAYKADAARKLAGMEQRIAVLETAAAREEDVSSIKKRYADKSQDDIDREFQEALKKIAEIKKLRKDG